MSGRGGAVLPSAQPIVTPLGLGRNATQSWGEPDQHPQGLRLQAVFPHSGVGFDRPLKLRRRPHVGDLGHDACGVSMSWKTSTAPSWRPKPEFAGATCSTTQLSVMSSKTAGERGEVFVPLRLPAAIGHEPAWTTGTTVGPRTLP